MSKNYREQANQLATQLSKENKQYFEKVSGYLGLSSLFLDEEKMNEQIYQIASDLVEAQNNGESAATYFGTHPKKVADEIVQNTPPSSWKERLSLLWECIGFFLVYQLAGDFNLYDKSVSLNPLRYAVNTCMMLLAIGLIFYCLKQFVYARTKVKQSGYFMLAMLSILAFLAWSLWTIDHFPRIGTISLSYPYDLVALGSLLVILIGIACFRRVKESSFSLVLGLLMTSGNLVGRGLYHFSSLSEGALTIVNVVILLIVYGGFTIYTIKLLKE